MTSYPLAKYKHFDLANLKTWLLLLYSSWNYNNLQKQKIKWKWNVLIYIVFTKYQGKMAVYYNICYNYDHTCVSSKYERPAKLPSADWLKRPFDHHMWQRLILKSLKFSTCRAMGLIKYRQSLCPLIERKYICQCQRALKRVENIWVKAICILCLANSNTKCWWLVCINIFYVRLVQWL